MSFIGTVPVQSAEGEVRELYGRQQATLGYVPNYVKVFSLRPEVYAAWAGLLDGVRGNMDARRYELVTLAAARALGSSYCSLAHGKVLRDRFYAPEALARIAGDFRTASLDPLDRAVMAFAEQVARDAASVTAQDVAGLRGLGLTDTEIFDVAAAASARCFFSKMLDALGAEPDAAYAELEGELQETLTVGRAITTRAPERLP
ncbi:carboxymuconolactone decarboxylase family protein [Deinococcus ficus]|uniref:carboxymuconolactone decarboxylase family protein n=1 Tax=Deinococcus ficus TaxID=317577 RepID=UPI00174D2EF0|nr:carboxymuconolactone decarboxylase family protein [Deinococcus ficus]GHF89098.1 hypothetical protein GCM10017782_27900 [Deinococcus ficus]